MKPLLHDGDLDCAVRKIWVSRLGLDLRPDDGMPDDSGRILLAVVRSEGPSRPALVMECPAPLARSAVASLLAVQPHVLNVEEVEDGLARIAEMLAAALWPDRPISRPRTGIVDDRADRPRVSERPALRRAAYTSHGQVFRVTVVS